MIPKGWTFWIIIVGSILAAGFVFVRYSFAHDHWIRHQNLRDPLTGQWCCDERDTQEETANVEAVPGGFRIISTGEVIAKERVIWRSPGGWWRSRNLSDGSTRCLIGPPMGA